MKSHDQMKSAEANDAAWEATRGAVVGAARWGIGAAVLGAAAWKFSPLLREYEARIRMQRRLMRDRAKWERFEQEFLENPEEKK
ncbi:hypothetical protein COL154_000310 [Colletotrichum chrysophilum]|nr:hypothetical protein CBS470a_000272 [Colletotrichum nupharicola]KAJ0323980.1 hypothetical protein Brms1b_001227 [Colletotrichum noveboracense]KAJ0355568.1 hypothetical protein KNSL1_000695 [Colletotrichum chrysophilum]KAJ0372577.1 hypothetical protein COL154_000310 [Colletotrichum chrysophilum]